MPSIESGASATPQHLLDVDAEGRARVSLHLPIDGSIELINDALHLPVTIHPMALGRYVVFLRTQSLVATVPDGGIICSIVWAGPYRFRLEKIQISARVSTAPGTGVLWGLQAFHATEVLFNTTGGALVDLSTGGARKRSYYPYSQIDGVMSSGGGVVETNVADTAALTAGTATLKTNPFITMRGMVQAVGGSPIFPGPIRNRLVGTASLELKSGEGIYIKTLGTGPTSGTIRVSISLTWAELEGVDP